MSVNPQNATELMRSLSPELRDRMIRENADRVVDARARFRPIRVVEDQGGD